MLEGVALGDSIAVNGVCLTVTGVEPDGADGAAVWSTDVMAETLSRSSLGAAVAGHRSTWSAPSPRTPAWAGT